MGRVPQRRQLRVRNELLASLFARWFDLCLELCLISPAIVPLMISPLSHTRLPLSQAIPGALC
eukprot:COSAG05_NODE_22056_length_267_cov_0.916667_2_plen_62_part_01